MRTPQQEFRSSENKSNIPEESPIIRGQNFNSLGQPQDQSTRPFYGTDPAGDPFANALTQEQQPGWVDLDVYLNEERTGRLMFGAGFNSDAGLVGSIVLQENNFDLFRPPTGLYDWRSAWRGGGQNFRMELVPGDTVSRYLVSWTDPYFMHTDYSFGVSGFYFNRYYPDWEERRAGGRLTLGRQITNEISVSSAFRFEEIRLRTGAALGTSPELDAARGSNTLTSIKLSAAHDTRDAAFLPTEGHFLQIGYEQAFGDFNFPKLTGEARQYFTLYQRPDGFGKQILTIGGEVGWAGDNTPIFEQFFAGGYRTFRGFDFYGVTPRTGVNGIGTGGLFQALGTVEYMVPLTANDAIAGVAFTDFGTVDENITLNNFRLSIGFGFRLKVPAMGPVPLAFDFAFPIIRENIDEERIFSFYVGISG